MSKKVIATFGNTHQPGSGSNFIKRTYSPQGSGQVPTNIPPLPSGVAPVTPSPAPAPPAATSTSQSGQGASSQGGK